jgi:hypothetical protein
MQRGKLCPWGVGGGGYWGKAREEIVSMQQKIIVEFGLDFCGKRYFNSSNYAKVCYANF